MQTAYVALTVLMNLPIRHTPLSEGGFGNTITTYAIQKGFANVVTMTGLRGRWETLEQSPLTICDTGHNSHGIKYVAEQLRHLHAQHQGTLRIVLGMVNDKDVNEVMRLLPEDAVYYFTEADTHRAIPAEEMKRKWIAIHPDWKGISHIYNNTLNAFNAIQRDKTDKDIIFYGGSNYIVGEIQKYYSIK